MITLGDSLLVFIPTIEKRKQNNQPIKSPHKKTVRPYCPSLTANLGLANCLPFTYGSGYSRTVADKQNAKSVSNGSWGHHHQKPPPSKEKHNTSLMCRRLEYLPHSSHHSWTFICFRDCFGSAGIECVKKAQNGHSLPRQHNCMPSNLHTTIRCL